MKHGEVQNIIKRMHNLFHPTLNSILWPAVQDESFKSDNAITSEIKDYLHLQPDVYKSLHIIFQGVMFHGAMSSS